MAEPDARKIRLLMHLRRAGISDAGVLRAMEKVPREMFIPEGWHDRAYEDSALPIECGQTISQPYIVALMTQALELDDRCKILEIGTGSGYQTAILARLARRVYTIERYRALLREAQARFAALKLTNIVAIAADGAKGWPEQAPFDRILVTAAAPGRPDALLDQLKPGGIMIAPVGAGDPQMLIRYRRTEQGIEEEKLADVRFVPLVPGLARAAEPRGES